MWKVVGFFAWCDCFDIIFFKKFFILKKNSDIVLITFVPDIKKPASLLQQKTTRKVLYLCILYKPDCKYFVNMIQMSQNTAAKGYPSVSTLEYVAGEHYSEFYE